MILFAEAASLRVADTASFAVDLTTTVLLIVEPTVFQRSYRLISLGDSPRISGRLKQCSCTNCPGLASVII